MRRGGPPLLPPPMAQLPVVSSPSPLHHRPWRSCLSCRRRRAAAHSTAACHVIAITPPPVAQLPVMSLPSRRRPWHSCLSCRRHRTTTHCAAATTLLPIVSPSRLLPVVPRLCCKQNLEHGACTEEVKCEKKEREKIHNSLSVLVPCFRLTWREEALVCHHQT